MAVLKLLAVQEIAKELLKKINRGLDCADLRIFAEFSRKTVLLLPPVGPSSFTQKASRCRECPVPCWAQPIGMDVLDVMRHKICFSIGNSQACMSCWQYYLWEQLSPLIKHLLVDKKTNKPKHLCQSVLGKGLLFLKAADWQCFLHYRDFRTIAGSFALQTKCSSVSYTLNRYHLGVLGSIYSWNLLINFGLHLLSA